MAVSFRKYLSDTSRMSFLFYAINLVLLVSFVVFVREMSRAPNGYEDASGFQLGPPPVDYTSESLPPMQPAETHPPYATSTPGHLAA